MTPAAWRRLQGTAAGLPPSTGGGIECRPASPDQADLLVRYFHPELRADAPDCLAPLARLWQRQPPPGRRIVWLELDVPAAGVPVASVFAGPGALCRTAAPDAVEWQAIRAALSPAAASEPLQSLLDSLPESAWLGYLGWMRGRLLRASVSGLGPASVPPLLDRLGWPGDAERLAGVLDLGHHGQARLTLGLDLADPPPAPLGIELAPDTAEGWDRLIAAAVPNAAEALRRWPGLSVTADGVRLVRRVNHLKFAFNGAAAPTVKAYLYYGLL